MNKFTPKQLELLELAKKGFLTMSDFNAVFGSPISRKANIERFLALGILELSDGKFIYIKEKEETK